MRDSDIEALKVLLLALLSNPYGPKLRIAMPSDIAELSPRQLVLKIRPETSTKSKELCLTVSYLEDYTKLSPCSTSVALRSFDLLA